MILQKRIILNILSKLVYFLILKTVNNLIVIKYYLKDEDFSMPISLNINFDNKKLLHQL